MGAFFVRLRRNTAVSCTAFLLFAAAHAAAGDVLVPFGDDIQVAVTPSVSGVGIQKSYAEQIGLGRGDVYAPGSSAYLVARDPYRAIARGRQLFQRKFSASQGLGPRTGDWVGDIRNCGTLITE